MLPPEQMEVLPQLESTHREGFFPHEGTAIALQLGHRESIDFDFFSDRELDEERLPKSIPLLEDAAITVIHK